MQEDENRSPNSLMKHKVLNRLHLVIRYSHITRVIFGENHVTANQMQHDFFTRFIGQNQFGNNSIHSWGTAEPNKSNLDGINSQISEDKIWFLSHRQHYIFHGKPNGTHVCNIKEHSQVNGWAKTWCLPNCTTLNHSETGPGRNLPETEKKLKLDWNQINTQNADCYIAHIIAKIIFYIMMYSHRQSRGSQCQAAL